MMAIFSARVERQGPTDLKTSASRGVPAGLGLMSRKFVATDARGLHRDAIPVQVGCKMPQAATATLRTREGLHPPGNVKTLALLAGLLNEAAMAFDGDVSAARACVARAAALLQSAQASLPEVTSSEQAASAGLAPWQLSRVTRHIEGNLENCTRIDDLARLVRLSTGHFSKAFRQSVGLSPHSFIIRCRIERAKKLMLTTDEPLCEISIACGLSDQAHLSRLFRRCTGRTPNAWRRDQRGANNAVSVDEGASRFERRASSASTRPATFINSI